MKKRLFLTFCLTLVFYSKTTYSQANKIYGISSLSFFLEKDPDVASYFQGVGAGFGFGFSKEISLTNRFSYEISPNFHHKRSKHYYHDTIERSEYVKLKFSYISIPVTLNYSLALRKSKLKIKLGYFAGLGLFGKRERHSYDAFLSQVGRVHATEKINWKRPFNGSNNEYKSLDHGVISGFDCEFDSFFFGAFYEIGLPDISLINSRKESTIYSRSIGVKIGLVLNSIKKGAKATSGSFK